MHQLLMIPNSMSIISTVKLATASVAFSVSVHAVEVYSATIKWFY